VEKENIYNFAAQIMFPYCLNSLEVEFFFFLFLIFTCLVANANCHNFLKSVVHSNRRTCTPRI